MKPYKVGAVVVNYNNPSSTRKTLKSLEKFHKNPAIKLVIYLVNNGCTDKESQKLEKEFNVSQITSSHNLGFAGGNNLGVNKALKEKCTHILILNNDIVISSDTFIKDLIASNFDMAAPMLEYNHLQQKSCDYGGKVDCVFGRNTHLSSPGNVEYFSGACLLVKSEVFKKLKGFDDRFFLYYEDVDFCLRAKNFGFTLGLVEDTIAFHALSASTNKLGSKKIKILAQSHYLFCKLHLPVFSMPFYLLFNMYLRLKSFFP